MKTLFCCDCQHKQVGGLFSRLLGWSDNWCNRPNRKPDLVTGIRQEVDYADVERSGQAPKYCGVNAMFFVSISNIVRSE